MFPILRRDTRVVPAADLCWVGGVATAAERWESPFEEPECRAYQLVTRARHGGSCGLGELVTRGQGTIINIVSHAGTYRWPLCSSYAVSKSALIKFSENLAAEVRWDGVSVFAYHPGLLAIGMTESLLATDVQPDAATTQVANWFRRQIAKGRSTTPEQSASALLALASGRYHGLTGCYLTVDDDFDRIAARIDDTVEPQLPTLRVSSA